MSIAELAPLDLVDDPVADPVLSALLRVKPDGDGVPKLVWWLVAEALRATVFANDALRGRPDAVVRQRLGEATLFTDLALEELRDATGSTPRADTRGPDGEPLPTFAAAAELRRTAVPCMRLLVSRRPTPPVDLATALARHRRALRRCQRAALSEPAPA